jgi:hypothetical protein
VEELKKKGWDAAEYQQINTWYQKEASKKGSSVELPEEQQSLSSSAYAIEEVPETVSSNNV